MLKPGGWLWICEVRSRFAGKADGGSGGGSGQQPPSGNSGGGGGTGDWVKLAFTRALQVDDNASNFIQICDVICQTTPF